MNDLHEQYGIETEHKCPYWDDAAVKSRSYDPDLDDWQPYDVTGAIDYIVKRNGRWFATNWEYGTRIVYCPWCGVKLE